MAAADRTNNTLSSTSSYSSQSLCDSSEHNTNIIDITPLPEHILRTAAAFMHNREYVIDDENAFELLKLSRNWNLDILAKLCETHLTNADITINNACRFYNFALDNMDQHKSQMVNEFIREHFTSLHESGLLSELSLKNFTAIIEHDEINVKNEDVIFSSAVQIINQQTSVEDINRCLELIRFPHTSEEFLMKVILGHPLMKEPLGEKYINESIMYQLSKTSIPDVKPPRYWGRSEIYYIGNDRCMYQNVCNAGDHESVKMMDIPEWVDSRSSVASHRKRMVIVGGWNDGSCDKRALLLDIRGSTKVTQLPDLPEPRGLSSIVLFDNNVYVVGDYNKRRGCLNPVYCLSLRNGAWQKKKPMPYVVNRPLVIRHQQCIYALGGYNSDCGHYQYAVLQYNIEEDTWKRCSNMPVACGSLQAGVVVHKGRIKVITVEQCLMYDDHTDTWTVKYYNKLGDSVNAFVRSGQICAAVSNGDKCSMMSYDDVDNVWITDHKTIDNAWYTCLFC